MEGLWEYIRRKNGLLLASPIDVQLDCDDKTIAFVGCPCCVIEKVIRRCIWSTGFIIEILSLSPEKKDMFTKLAKYKEAGSS